ncbi:MAG: hypothetical protein KKF44_11515 [Nanoarchaeota archaeon]|nr:hypothetical protein [Nanoarchaeota archaeon]
MGHTVLSQRQVVDGIIRELSDFGKTLRHEEREAFESLLSKIKLHIASISFACSYNTWALVLFSILLEQEKKLTEIEEERKGK